MNYYERVNELITEMLLEKKKPNTPPEDPNEGWITPRQLQQAKTDAQTKKDRDDYALKLKRQHQLNLALAKNGTPDLMHLDVSQRNNKMSDDWEKRLARQAYYQDREDQRSHERQMKRKGI